MRNKTRNLMHDQKAFSHLINDDEFLKLILVYSHWLFHRVSCFQIRGHRLIMDVTHQAISEAMTIRRGESVSFENTCR